MVETISFEFWLKFLFIATGFSVLATWTWEFLFVPIFEYILDLIRYIRRILKSAMKKIIDEQKVG